MTSSVQSHLPSERCLYERQCPEQAHVVFEDLGVVAGGERSGWSHTRTRFLDVSALGVEASAHAVLSVEASAHVLCSLLFHLADEELAAADNLTADLDPARVYAAGSQGQFTAGGSHGQSIL